MIDTTYLAENRERPARLQVTRGAPWRISGSVRARWLQNSFLAEHAIDIRQIGDSQLREPALKPRLKKPQLQELVANMFASMVVARGIGIAAPQIGVPLKVVIIDVDEVGIVALEPRIVET